jgi:TonB family protein
MDANMLQVPTTVGVGTGKSAPKLFEITELDRVPRRIRTGQPHYPQEFLRARIEGDVQLLVVIDTSGRVRVASVLETTHPEFTRAAISAAQQSLYEPPIKGGVAVSAQYTLRVPFRLNAKD